MGADPPAIAGFGGAALSAGLSDMVAGSVVGAVSMDSCLISDIRVRQVRRPRLCQRKYSEGKLAKPKNGKPTPRQRVRSIDIQKRK